MLIYDCEIAKAIPGRNEERQEGIEYCEGWRDFNNMGISVICAYDYVTHRYRCFMQDNLEEFQQLVLGADCVVSFNGLAFDNQLCAANDIVVPAEKSYDLLVEIWAGDGLGPNFSPRTHGGYGLDKCAQANFNYRKTGHGAFAPVLWQQGKYGEVVDYCLNDIMLTKKLLDRVLKQGFIISPVTDHSIIRVKPPRLK